MYVQQLSFWLKITHSVTNVEEIINIPSTKVIPRQRTPPKKQKRAVTLIALNS